MATKVNKSKMACNKPKRTPSHPKKSHVVKACSKGKEKALKQDTQKILNEVKCQLLTGQTKLNGNER